MIKKLLFTFLLAFVCFFGIDRVFASSETLAVPYYIYDYDGVKYSTGSSTNYTNFPMNFKIDFSTNQYLNIQSTGQVLYWDDIEHSNGDASLDGEAIYARVSLCVTNNVSSGWSDNDYVKDVMFTGYNGIKCNVYGGGKGYLVQATYKVLIWKMGPADFRINNVITTNVTAPNSISYIGIEYGKQPFPRYNEYDTLISQNTQIIQLLSRQNNNDVVAKINETNQKLTETNQKLEETNKTLKDDDTSESTSEATEFFEGFDTDTHGLTSIITAPLELIGNIAGSTCSPLPLTLPFVNKSFSLPCMDSIYKKHFGSFLTIYQTITFGIVAYWVCVRIFALVKDFKNPEHDEIEVMDL